VVKRGAPGTPDALGVQFYGSIIKEKLVSSDHPWVEPKKMIEPLRSLKLPVADEQKILSGTARQLFGLS
jgi:predicted TIM-barrel fold metal-dependent hydrolase